MAWSTTLGGLVDTPLPANQEKEPASYLHVTYPNSERHGSSGYLFEPMISLHKVPNNSRTQVSLFPFFLLLDLILTKDPLFSNIMDVIRHE